MFNGYVMVWFEFEVHFILALALPASCYWLERWLKKRTAFNALCFACAIGISLYSGFAHLLIYQFLFVGTYILYRLLPLTRLGNFLPGKNASDPPKINRQDMLSLWPAVLSILCISAVFFASHLSLLDDAQRHGFGFEELYRQTGRLPLKYLTTLIFPDFFGNPAINLSFPPGTGGPQPYNNYNELCIYAGILPLFLGLASLPHLFRKRHAAYFFLAAVIPLTMAMGSILYYPLMKFVPGLNLSTPTRLLYLFGFSFSVLAAIGADILLDIDTREERRCLILLWALVPVIGVSIFFLVQTESGMNWVMSHRPAWQYYSILKAHFAPWSPVMLKPVILMLLSFLFLTLTLFFRNAQPKIIFLLLSMALLSYDLISFGLFYNTTSPRSLAYPPTEAIRFLQKDHSNYRIITYGKFMHNSFSPFGIEDVGGYSSVYPKRYGEFLHLSQHGPSVPFPDSFSRWIFFERFGSPLLDMINTKYVLIPPSLSVQNPKLRLVFNKGIKIYENSDAFPRAFFVPEYHYCATREDAYQTMATFTSSDFRHKVILESLPPDFREPSATGEIKSEIETITYEPNRIVLKVSADQKGLLVLSNNYHPGWRARVNGEETEILRANYIMQAVPIDAGTHKVEFLFRPRLIMAGIIITVVGWGLLVLLMGYFRRR